MSKILNSSFVKVPPTASLKEFSFPSEPVINKLWISDTQLINMEGFPPNCDLMTSITITRNHQLITLQGIPSTLPALERLSLTDNLLSSFQFLPKSLPNLEKIDVASNPFQILDGFPSNASKIIELRFEYSQLQSFEGLPANLPNLKFIYFQEAQVHNFMGLPQDLPNLTILHGADNRISSFKGLPVNLPNAHTLVLTGNLFRNLEYFPIILPKLKMLYLENNELESLEGIPNKLPAIQEIFVEGNPIRSLSYISRSVLPAIAKNIYRFSPQNPNFNSELNITNCLKRDVLDLVGKCISTESGLDLVHKSSQHEFIRFNADALDELYEYFRITPLQLAQQYIKGESLTKLEIQRLSHEASPRERYLLENAKFPADNPVIAAISARLHVDMPAGYTIMK
jgi:Leucine-rich repeat (LRR) protein